MKSFCVVHLSDLHISDREDGKTSNLRNALIRDLVDKVQSQSLNVDAIAVTGDSVDRGGSAEAFHIAEEYYKQLIHALNIEKENVLFVPGNHDFPRRTAIQVLLEKTPIDDFYNKTLFTEHWETFEVRQKSFQKMVYNITGTNDFENSKYGGAIRTIQTENGSMRFILLNSSWSCTGEQDYNNLFIGKWQLEELLNLNRKLPPSNLVLGLMHHPIDWLKMDDQKLILENLTKPNGIGLDAILHGHIHTGRLDYKLSPDRGLLSLVSGVGYPDKKNRGIDQFKVSNCRYAIYKFDVDSGLLNVQLRVSNENGSFAADTLLYDLGKENGVFTIPYKLDFSSMEQGSALEKNSNRTIETPIEIDFVPRIQEFVGRGEEISILQRRKLSVIAITGVGGQGKTGLASEILRRYTRVENPIYDYGVWVDCRELPDSLHFKLIETLDRLSRGVESVALYRDEKMEDTVKRFIKHLTNSKILIVFDNIDAYVKADTEGPVEELKPLFEALCNNTHSSLAIFTCRPPLIHSSGSFHHFQLSGLTQNDAVDFFIKRGVQLSGDNAEPYCEQIVSLTKGHPWWLGLIAGQVNTKQDSLKLCVNKFSVSEVTSSGPIYEYFKDIWSQLNKERQNILRYLVEAHRPLNEDEIGIVVHDNGPDKLKRELRRLSRLGLVEPHESASSNGQFITYQVHPLIREFVHESYSTTAQERYVQRVLYVFLPKRVIDFLFKADSEIDDSIVMSPAALMDSIETCLNSRNAEKALNLLDKYNSLLYNSGYHHKYQSLACRVLDSIHWENQGLVTRHSEFLESIITHLCYKGEQYRSNYYLKKYESLVESGTLAYLNYLKLACGVAWNEGRNEDCITFCKAHVELSAKLETTYGSAVVKHHYALALRDSGAVEEALSIFHEHYNSGYKSTNNEAIYKGNCARCYSKLNNFTEAESNIRESLKLLAEKQTYYEITNIGYAYLWISEIMFDRQKYRDSKAFTMLAEKVWQEYAPGLIYKIKAAKDKFMSNSIWNNESLTDLEIKQIESKFITGYK